jgi:hypothetical protein
MQRDGGEDGQQVGEAGRDISSTPSGDVEMLEEQDQELVVGTGTHLGGVVAKARAKVQYTNAFEKREMGRWHGHYQVQLSLGDTQGATMWVHKGADLELYS